MEVGDGVCNLSLREECAWEEFPDQSECRPEQEPRIVSGKCDPGQHSGEGWGSGERRGGGCQLGQPVGTWNAQKRWQG